VICLKTAAFLACFCVAGGLKAQDQSANSISREVKDIFERSGKAVVKIYGSDEHGENVGTGFFVDPTGTIYTSYSVGGDADSYMIEFQGKKVPAHQAVADTRTNLAILKVDVAVTTPSLPVGRSDELEIATPVVTIGFPLDLPKTPSFGMIAGFDHKYLGHPFPLRIRANLPAQRGEAGSPLLNLKGEVVGIVVAGLENSSACYAVPIEVAEKIRNDYVRFGEVRHGWIGAEVKECGEPIEGSTVETTALQPGTPAAESGMKEGDIVVQIGRTKIHEPEDIFDASLYMTAGDPVPITVVRKGEKMTFTVQPELHPFVRDHRLAAPTLNNNAIPLKLETTRTP
jgi:serine protease Do